MICPNCPNTEDVELCSSCNTMKHTDNKGVCGGCSGKKLIDVEMDLVECFTDTYDFRGEHKQVDLGLRWICPQCDYELEHHNENNI